MSTKNTIRFSDVQAEQGFHVYWDWEDDYDNNKKMPEFIHLELERCEFEARHKDGASWVDVKIPTALAREIGLINGWRERGSEVTSEPIPIPEAGKTYISQEDPTLIVYAESVEVIEADEYGKAGFVVTCCPPSGKGDPSVPGFELVDDEWESFRFVPVA